MTINSASMYRIRKGETFGVVAFSSVAVTLIGRMRVLYDNGKMDEFILNETPSGSSRAAVLATCGQHVAEDNGIVVDMWAASSGTVLQRGQLYLQAGLASDPGFTTITVLLGQGYRYQNFSVVLGQFTEAGPAGGPGAITEANSADPAANAEIPDQTVPTGALWKLLTFTVQLVQGITQTPLPTLTAKRSGGGIDWEVPITTTAIGASSTARLTWGRGLVQSSFSAVIGDEFHTAPIPDRYLIAGNILDTITDGIGANTNYGAANYTYEEWVMPN